MNEVREKLIETLGRYVSEPPCDTCKTPIGHCDRCGLDRLADHLLANGVAIGKPLTEYLHPVDDYAGLKGKYLVFKADTGEQVINCFVLRPDKDIAAVEALRAYANATDNKTLSRDIHNWVGKGEAAKQWIPVTERLPEIPDGWAEHPNPVLYMMKSTRTIYAGYYGENGTYRDKYFRQYHDRYEGVDADDVLCWMWQHDLPEPPKGE